MFIIILIPQTKTFMLTPRHRLDKNTNKPETAGEFSGMIFSKYEQGKLLGVFFMWIEQAFIMSLL